MYATGGSSSNKIYEYMSCGLPTIYFKAKTYQDSLGSSNWAVSTDLLDSSLKICFDTIIQNYNSMRNDAAQDFKTKFNYQNVIKNIIN